MADRTGGLMTDVEMLKTQLKDILTFHTGRLDALEKAPGRSNSGGGKSFVKAILDSKVIMALKMLGNDRSEYRRWKERFENAFDQARPGARTLLEGLGNKVMAEGIPYDAGVFNQDKVDDWIAEISTQDEDLNTGDWTSTRMSKDLKAVLTEKCEGEAYSMIKNASGIGGGMEAWMKIHDWFSRISGLGMAERRTRVMMPNQAKKEDDIIYDVEKWKREMREVEQAVENEGGEGKLPYAFKITALRKILVGKIGDHIKMRESTLMASMTETGEAKYKKIYEEIEKEVYSYARMEKLEKQRKSDDKMDTDALDDDERTQEGSDEDSGKSNDWDGHDEGWGEWIQEIMINALGKGKSMGKGGQWGKGGGKGGKGGGKGFTGKCFNCGKEGHSARFCRKGAGKGEAGAQRPPNPNIVCYTCGKTGHPARLCPDKQAGKGSWGGPPAKGVNEVDNGGAKKKEVEFLDLGMCSTGYEKAHDSAKEGAWSIAGRNKKKCSTKYSVAGTHHKKQIEVNAVYEEIDAVDKDSYDNGRWEKLVLTMDSGAMESVAPRKIATNVKVRKDNGKEGQCYRTANGSEIPNQGEKRLQWKTHEGDVGGLTVQITDVTKALGSVGKICEAGNRVVFEPDGGYVENMNSSKKTMFYKDGLAYRMDMWVKAKNQEDELMNVDEEKSEEAPPFMWQDLLP